MKVLVNGGINLSNWDGWWAEAYTPEWVALGDGQEHGDDPAWDAVEARRSTNLLEREVIPEFYAGTQTAFPPHGSSGMRESMALLTPRFSADRTVREYTEQRYLPAATAFRERAANKVRRGRQIVDWQHASSGAGGLLRFGEVRVDTSAEHHVFEVDLFLNDLDPNAVRVELYAEGINGGDPVREAMRCVRPAPERGTPVSIRQPYRRHALQVTTRRESITSAPRRCVPLESNRILWQRR